MYSIAYLASKYAIDSSTKLKLLFSNNPNNSKESLIRIFLSIYLSLFFEYTIVGLSYSKKLIIKSIEKRIEMIIIIIDNIVLNFDLYFSLLKIFTFGYGAIKSNL